MIPQSLRDPSYLPTREEIEFWRWPGTNAFDNWDDYVHHNPLWFNFEILNREFIDSLCSYLNKRIAEILESWKERAMILETWAWSWRLGHFLRDWLPHMKDWILKIISTDNLSWETSEFNPYFHIRRDYPVEVMDYRKAIDKHPDIIITSWMPKDEDWTADYRKCSSVGEYILIWNQTDCWSDATWDERLIWKDDFSAMKLDVSWQMCFRDHPWNYANSSTISFRRANSGKDYFKKSEGSAPHRRSLSAPMT
ncbi:MAG: hypothetical protein ACD_2C00092G0001 [uncultured bacterium (gcode 4)]|uniref:Uncharacterized protein n=1 Tax=uncultured bacterium (gcode 4) TaxID=1234023 RepID=K2G3J7_9BACT|nr:MAG: hypothetical protein ACD_2C00092G0001 [uncultured bacterium (gcode 4)]